MYVSGGLHFRNLLKGLGALPIELLEPPQTPTAHAGLRLRDNGVPADPSVPAPRANHCRELDADPKEVVDVRAWPATGARGRPRRHRRAVQQCRPWRRECVRVAV